MSDLSANWVGQRGAFLFHCPGCDFVHVVGSGWSWDGNRESPTFTPSLLVTVPEYGGTPEYRCHSFIRAGRIEFLRDCHHALAGKTVDIPEWKPE